MDRSTFIEKYGGVCERSPWIAAAVYDECAGNVPADAGVLHRRFEAVIMAADRGRQLALLRAHPELAGKTADRAALTGASRREQRGAGLDLCSAEKLAMFQDLNARYREKFGFPFIIAVRHRDPGEILEAFRQRLDNDAAQEFCAAVQQVCRIARYRIEDILHG